jgi:phosphatidate cytidylyltransferase
MRSTLLFWAHRMARILTALVLLLLLKGPFWLITVAACAVAMLACWEFLALADATGAKTPRALVLISIVILFCFTFRRSDVLAPILSALALIIFSVISFRSPLKRVLLDTSASVFSLLYIGLSLTTIPLISQQEDGPALLVFLFFAVWSGDVAALYVGRSLGKHKLAPAVSPNKTWEGSIASILGSMAVTGLLLYLANTLQQHGIETLLYPGSIAHWLGLSIVLNIAAQIGDLVESAIKRGAGVKDSGTLLPGHGGVLDRIDALLTAAPVLWYALLLQQSF